MSPNYGLPWYQRIHDLPWYQELFLWFILLFWAGFGVWVLAYIVRFLWHLLIPDLVRWWKAGRF